MKQVRTLLIYMFLLTLVIGVFAVVSFRLANQVTSKPPVGISGVITRDGKPLQWNSDVKRLWVQFGAIPIDDSLEVPIYPAETDASDGTFRIQSIPVGEYKIYIMQMGEDSRFDQLNFVFDPAHSNLVRRVEHDGQVIHIDLPKELPKTSRSPAPKKDE